MKIAAHSGLSEAQNRIFARRWIVASERLGIEIEKAPDPASADLAYLCGLPASRMLATHQPVLAPVLSPERYQEHPWYFVDVVAGNRELGLATGRWAYNQPQSFSGWLAVRHGLRLHHIDPASVRWVATGSHAGSLDAIRAGRADLAGIDSMILDLDADASHGVKIVDSWGPWPTPPVMVSRALDSTLVTNLVAALMGSDEGVTWVEIDQSHLDPIIAVAADATIAR